MEKQGQKDNSRVIRSLKDVCDMSSDSDPKNLEKNIPKNKTIKNPNL